LFPFRHFTREITKLNPPSAEELKRRLTEVRSLYFVQAIVDSILCHYLFAEGDCEFYLCSKNGKYKEKIQSDRSL
jgi:hypothetical protein